MKRKTLIIVLLCLLPFFSFTQGLTVEQFDASWTGSPPAPPGWTVVNEYGPQRTWIQTVVGNATQSPYGGIGHSAYLQRESVAGSAAVPMDWLITKPFTMPSDGELHFLSKLTIQGDNGGVYKVMVVQANGNNTEPLDSYTLLQTWTELQLNPDQTAWTAKTVSIPNNWTEQVRIAFVMQGNNKDNWFIDNVRVSSKCNAPTTLKAINITSSSADLSWTNPVAGSWEIEILKEAEARTGTGVLYTGTLPYSKIGLELCTTYKYYVKQRCTVDGGESIWVGPFFFKTNCIGETCANPIVIPTALPYTTSNNTANFGDFYEGKPGTGCNASGNYLVGNDTVYSFTPIVTGDINIRLYNIGGEAAGVFVYSSCLAIGNSCVAGGTATAIAPLNIPVVNVVAGTTYYIVISANEKTFITPYTLTIQQNSCSIPSNGVVNSVTASSSIISWTPGTVGAFLWEVAVQSPGSGVPSGSGQSTTHNTNFSVTTTNSGGTILDATTYEYYVREACGGNTFSIWCGPFLFTTAQLTAPLNYTQNFNANAHGWTLSNGTQINKWAVGTATSNGSGKSLYISNNNGITNSYTTSGENTAAHAYKDIQLPAGTNQLNLSFDWKYKGESNYDFIKIWLVPTTFTPIPGTKITPDKGIAVGSILQSSDSWKRSVNIISVSGLGSTTQRVVFEWVNDISGGSQPPAAIDNINISVISCQQPLNPFIASLSENEATINWTSPTSNPNSYDVFYSDVNASPPIIEPITANVASTSITIQNLTPSAIYYIWIRSSCGAEDKSLWTGPVIFNVPQIPASMYFAENFDFDTHNFTLSNGVQTNKWVIGTATSNGLGKSLYISDDNGVTNNYFGSSESVLHAYRDIQIPADIPSNQFLFKFNWKSGGNLGDRLNVWFLPQNYTPVSGVKISEGNGNILIYEGLYSGTTWQNFETLLTGISVLEDTVLRLAFEWINDDNTTILPAAAIDNIILSVVQCSPISDILIESANVNATTVTWTAPLVIPSSYDYYYSESNTAPDALTTVSGNVLNPIVVLNTLEINRSYNIWVRSNCGNEKSIWTGPINFRTPQIPVNLPYTENFDVGNNPGFSYTENNNPNKWAVGVATYNSPSKCLYVTNDNGITNNYTDEVETAIHAYRDINIPLSTNEIDISFDWKCFGIYSDAVRVWLIPVTFTPIEGIRINNSNNNKKIGNNFNKSTEWVNANYVLDVSAFAGTAARLVFEWVNDNNEGVRPPGAIDNIEIKVITCPKPVNLSVINQGITQVTLNWTESGAATLWEVYVVKTGQPHPTTITEGVQANTNSLLYTDLEQGTKYEYYVKSICGEGDESFWSGPFAFNTVICEIDNQCFYDFILTDFGNDGWENNTITVSQRGIIIANLGSQIADGGPVTVSVPLCSGEPYEVFWVNGNNAVPQASGSWEIGLKILNPYNNQIVFQQIAGSSANMGTTIYRGMAYCSPITCKQPSNLVSETTTNAANTTELSWLTDGDQAQWEVLIQPQGEGFPVNTLRTGTTHIVNGMPNHTEVITPEVLYEYYVRAICGPDDKSFWSGPLYFSIFTPPACADIIMLDGESEVVVPGKEYMHCAGDEACIDFTANYSEIGQTISYAVESIPYNLPFPITGGTKMDISRDDQWAPAAELPFEFCFFGQLYNRTQVGSNGLVSFNTNYPTGSKCEYSFDSHIIPNSDFPVRNAIYGVYQDVDFSKSSNPDINYQVIGNYPCRAFVVNFSEVAPYGNECYTDPLIGPQTSQIVIYEITNIIEVYVKNRVACTSWENGDGVIGIQNAEGTIAYTPEGRNTGSWTAKNEAWRFTPNGASSSTFVWLKDGVLYSTDKSIEVCANGAAVTTMTARVTYNLCNGENVVRESNVVLKLQEEIITADPKDLSACGNGEIITFDLNNALVDITNPTDYTFKFYATQAAAEGGEDEFDLPVAFETTASTVIWVRIVKNNSPCYIVKSFDITISNIAPVFTVTSDYSICAGDVTPHTIVVMPNDFNVGDATYEWTLNGAALPDTTPYITAITGGVYKAIVNNNGCVGTATITVTALTIPVVDHPSDVTVCGVYILPVLTSGGYYTGTNGSGTKLYVGDVITTTQTIYVFAESGTTPNCTDEQNFIVTIESKPSIAEIKDVTACDVYALPALSVGHYFTEAGGTGTKLADGASITKHGTTTVYVYSKSDTSNCTIENSFIVTIIPKVIITTSQGCDDNVYVLEVLFDVDPTYSQDNTTIEWTNSIGAIVGADAKLAVIETGIYTVTVTPNGDIECPVSYNVMVDATTCMIPRGISPNNDGKNDEFDLSTLYVKHLSIFNRYGKEVYRKDNYTKDWHGQDNSGDELPTGTYFYMIEREGGESQTGWVYINE